MNIESAQLIADAIEHAELTQMICIYFSAFWISLSIIFASKQE